MLASIIAGFTFLIVAIILVVGTGGVRTPPPHVQKDQDTRDMPGYLD